MSSRKLKKDELNKGAVEKGCSSAKSCVKKYFGDVNNISASKQIILGTSAGWWVWWLCFSVIIEQKSTEKLFSVTGLLSAKVGKVIAIAIGSGIIILQVANHNGYLKINWDKVNRNVDRVVDKVEEQLTGEGPSWMDKVSLNFIGSTILYKNFFIGRKICREESR